MLCLCCCNKHYQFFWSISIGFACNNVFLCAPWKIHSLYIFFLFFLFSLSAYVLALSFKLGWNSTFSLILVFTACPKGNGGLIHLIYIWPTFGKHATSLKWLAVHTFHCVVLVYILIAWWRKCINTEIGHSFLLLSLFYNVGSASPDYKTDQFIYS